MKDPIERYKVEGTIRVNVETIVYLDTSNFKKQDVSWRIRRKTIEALMKEKICIRNYDGNGGSDKLIGVVGRDNAISYDAAQPPRLLRVKRID